MLFGHVIRMDESADARRILTAVPQSDWRRPVGRPHSSWMATLKNDLSLHSLTFEDAIEMALHELLWGLLAASGATHWWCMPNNDDDDDVKLKLKYISGECKLEKYVGLVPTTYYVAIGLELSNLNLNRDFWLFEMKISAPVDSVLGNVILVILRLLLFSLGAPADRWAWPVLQHVRMASQEMLLI